MAHLTSKQLFRSTMVEVTDVRCHAPRSGRGGEEESAAPQIVVPRRGVFVIHRDGREVVADTNTALIFVK